MRGWLLVVLLTLFGSPVWAADGFSELVDAVERQDDARAIEVSRGMAEAGEGSFGLYYNQGLAYRNLEQLGHARAAFEQAILHAPRDLDARRRLREVKESLSAEVAESDVTGTPLWSPEEAALLLILSSLLVLSLGIARAVGRRVSRSRLSAAMLVFVALFLLAYLNNPAPERAVVVSSSAKLLGEPEGGASGPALPEGVLVEVVDQTGHFVQIALGDGSRGWVRSAELVRL